MGGSISDMLPSIAEGSRVVGLVTNDKLLMNAHYYYYYNGDPSQEREVELPYRGTCRNKN